MEQKQTIALSSESEKKYEKRIMVSLLSSQPSETTFYQEGGILYNEEKIAFIDLRKSQLSIEEIKALGYNIIT